MQKISANLLTVTRYLAGLVSEVLMRKKEMEVLTNLKNIVILDCDAETLYKKVCVCGCLRAQLCCHHFDFFFTINSLYYLYILIFVCLSINPASIICKFP